ncbi:MAG: DUF1565 domain-containing protein, partial [Candidatus Cloacimonetes bacterium]|nr:DUF1565 domain-containing protein [Candidatus Cloacimonadota bacterium]
ENIAGDKGGGISCSDNSTPNFNTENRCNIFLNYAGLGNDLYMSSFINVIVDTFTVLQPDEHFAYPINNFTFDILNNKVEQVNQDLYVCPTGSNNNSGLSPEEPLLTISYALAKIIPDSTNPHTIYLADGTYSPSQTGEFFPINCKSYVSLMGENELSTILNCEGLRRVLYLKNDNYFEIEDISIKNGYSRYGGGIYFKNSSPCLKSVNISGNNARYKGGGIYCDYSSPSLTNVNICGNSSASAYCSGGGIYCYNLSSPILTNVTISENTASSGGGIYCYESNPILVNCILWNDTPQEIYIESAAVTATYSDIQDGWPGEGNIDADPLFVDPQNGDFHLTWANFPIPDSTMSPCIDAGDPTSPLDPDSTRADMGTFYFDQNQQGIEEMPILPTRYLLYQNYPNPFNPDNIGTTTISFDLATNHTNLHEQARIKIYNIKGQLVKQLSIDNYQSSIKWDGKDEKGNPLSSGIYFYKLEIDNKIIDIKKCLLLR